MKYRFWRIISTQYFLWKIGLKYVKAFFWERSLAEQIPKVETKIAVEIRLASVNDFRGFPSFRDEALKRLNNDDLCFVAMWNGTIVGYVWASLKRKVYIPEFEREIVFNNGEAYLYDGFVFPDFRRKSILKNILEAALHYLKSQNVKRANACTLTANEPPQRALRDAGFRAVKFCKFVKIFRFEKFEEHKLGTRPHTT